MKAVFACSALVFTIILALILTACANDSIADNPKVPENTATANDNNTKDQDDIVAEPAPSTVSLVYQEQDKNYDPDVNDFLTEADKDPGEYLKESFFPGEWYMDRYFVKLYETDYSEEELIEKVYPTHGIGTLPPLDHLPNPSFTATRCADDVPSKPGESNFLPEGAKVYLENPYIGFSLAAAVYETDDGEKMSILKLTNFRYDQDQSAIVPFVRFVKEVYIENAGHFTPQMNITVGPSKAVTRYLAARYYADSTDVTSIMLDEILQGAEYAGEVSTVISRNIYVENDSESNFLPKGTKIYTTGEEAIAVLPEPQIDKESGKYIVAVRLFKSESAIDSAEARKLVNAEKE